MIASDRLKTLSGAGGTTAAERMRRIGIVGATAGALLVAYSGLASATAAEHLLHERVQVQQAGGLVGGRLAASRKRTPIVAPTAQDDLLGRPIATMSAGHPGGTGEVDGGGLTSSPIAAPLLHAEVALPVARAPVSQSSIDDTGAAFAAAEDETLALLLIIAEACA